MLSVIIPVYKVESFLDQCLQSVVNQTYHDLEIILVDDGSPDNCPALCDAWAEKDARIRVLHKTNGGLSDARNAGISEAHGAFVSFLDSDDYIDEHMYEKLMQVFEQQEQVGIAACLFYTDTEGAIGVMTEKWEFQEPVVVSGDDFGRNKMLQETPHPVWNKVYRAELLQETRFRTGRINEDVLFMYDLAKVMKEKGWKEYIIPEHLLYYRIRQDGICRSKKRFFQLDIVENLRILLEESLKDGSGLHDTIYQQYLHELRTLVYVVGIDPDQPETAVHPSIFVDVLKLCHTMQQEYESQLRHRSVRIALKIEKFFTLFKNKK